MRTDGAAPVSVWRVRGEPLIPATGHGVLDGETAAVKDLYAIAGQRVGAGNPAWLMAADVETAHAPVVADLLAAGADVAGLAHTDEFAYSLAGTNTHYGAAPNPRGPGRIGGGSSSGSAAAVALGEASIGLGTDTGGSIRVPAAYQGLYGIRTSHGAVSTAGLLPLAPSFDTVGWLTRNADVLRAVGRVLLPATASGPADPVRSADPVLLADLIELATPDVQSEINALGLPWLRERCSLPLTEWAESFRVVQAYEAWQQHGVWLTGRLGALGGDVRGRFEAAAAITAGEADAARDSAQVARDVILDLVGDRVVVLPAAPTVAPLLGADPGAVRAATLQLTCLAGLGGLPAVTVPLATRDGLPCGACLLAAPGRDHDLLDLAVALSKGATA